MPLTITAIVPDTQPRGQAADFVVTGTGFPADIAIRFEIDRGACLLGGHTLALNPTLAVNSAVETARSVLDASQIDNANPQIGITDAVIGQFNAAGIALCYCIRFADPLDSDLDDPPLAGEARYDGPLAALTTLLNVPGSELQTCIVAGRFMIGFFNEISGGPGSFRANNDADFTESYARAARGLLLMTGWVAHLRANVTNGSLIRFCTGGLTSVELIAPGYVPQTDAQTWRQAIMRGQVDWAQDMQALYGTGVVCVDGHFNCSGLTSGDKSLRTRLSALMDYAASVGYSLEWLSNEFGPAFVRVEGAIPTDTDGLALVAAEEESMWLYAFSKQPYHLQRNPFSEQAGVGGGFVSYSVVESNQTIAKEPFATMMNDLIAETKYPEPMLVVGSPSGVTPTQFSVNVRTMGLAAEGVRNVVVSYTLISLFEATLSGGMEITQREEWEPDPDRVFDVNHEDRTMLVPLERRTIVVGGEDRACSVPSGARVAGVLFESRRVNAT